MLPAQTAGIGLLATGSEEDLCGQDVFVARPGQLLQCSSHLNLGLSIGVDLSGIEGVDTVVPGGLQTLLDNVTLLGTTVGEPASETEDGDLQSSWAQVAEDL